MPPEKTPRKRSSKKPAEIAPPLPEPAVTPSQEKAALPALRRAPRKKTEGKSEPTTTTRARAVKPRTAKAEAIAPATTVETLPPVTTRESVSPEPKLNPLSILMVSPEAHPFAKTGGLAEVSAALTDALARIGHRVTLVLPRYRGIAV